MKKSLPADAFSHFVALGPGRTHQAVADHYDVNIRTVQRTAKADNFRYVRERATGEWQQARSGDTYRAGLDLAKVEDFTVLTIMNQRREVVWS